VHYDERVKIIAEIGWNHMGDMNLAEEMISSAAESGADICKFQTWSEKHLKSGAWDGDGRREIYKKAQLTEDDHLFLVEVCKKHSVGFLTAVFNSIDIPFLSKLNPSMVKIPSHEVYNLDLIKACTNRFETVYVSTGAADWKEILDITNSVDMDKVTLLHCVSAYPCPAGMVNLPRIEALKTIAERVGYSGHFHGIDDAIAAICQGITIVEKHFTIDNELPGRDNQFAILPIQMKTLSEFRDNFVEMKSDMGRNKQDCERDTFDNYRGRWSKND
jgi:N,N'-diacetyllegionaminate synthase